MGRDENIDRIIDTNDEFIDKIKDTNAEESDKLLTVISITLISIMYILTKMAKKMGCK